MSELSQWTVTDPGDDFGRIDPKTATPFEGDYVLCLGSERGGRDMLLAPGDRYDVFQSEDPTGGKIFRFKARLRGPNTMPAISDAENFVLADGQTLILAVDYGANQTITFNTGDFVDITNARAHEVAGVINAQTSGVRAFVTGADQFGVRSLAVGRRSRVRVVGGSALAALGLAELAWKASLRLDGTELASEIIRAGDVRAPLDMAANLTDYSDPLEIRFRLEVVTL